MKAYQLTCPCCGATLDFEKNNVNDFIFCTYCGNKIFLDDEVTRIEIKKTYTNTAKVVKAKSQEKIKLQELEYKERESKRSDIILVLLIIICLAVPVGMDIFYTNESRPKENEIKITTSASDYKGENYETVQKELQAAGFTNIETDEIDDLITGWVKKEGDIEKISINGDSNFTAGDKFSKDATVIITYHARKK